MRPFACLLLIVVWSLSWLPVSAQGDGRVLIARRHHRQTPTPTPDDSVTPSVVPPLASPSPSPSPEVTPSATPTLQIVPSATPSPAATPSPSPSPSPVGPPDASFKGLKLPVGQTCTYQVSWQGTPVGFSRFNVEREVELGGERFYIVNSVARVKLGRGTIVDSGFRNKLIVSAVNLKPSYYFSHTRRGKAEEIVEVLFGKDVIAQKNTVGKTVQAFAYGAASSPWLLDENLWGRFDACAEHYLMLGLAAQVGGTAIPAYDPELQGGGRVVPQPAVKTTVKLADGTRVPALVYTLSDLQGAPNLRVAMQVGTPRLLWVQQVGGGLRFDLADDSVVAKSNRWPGADVTQGQAIATKIFFADPETLRELKLTLKAQVQNPTLLNHRVAGFDQAFTGDATPAGAVDGTITVHTSAPTITGRAYHPESDKDLAGLGDPRYLKPELGIESETPPVRNKALELSWKVPSAWDACRKMTQWVHTHVKTGDAPASARLVLAASQGDSEGKALLLTGMCRAVGIPARVVGGLLFEQGSFVPHTWTEVYLGVDGWVPMDPDTGEMGTLGASHVSLWERGQLLAGSLEVADYLPKPERHVSYYNRDITWPVGEQRIFSIHRGGKLVGQETAFLELGESKGDDVYHFVSTVQLDDGNSKATREAHLVLNSDALPVQAQYTVGRGSQTVVFGKGTITTKLDGRDGEKTRDIPYSRGVYVADGRFLSQLALIFGQAPELKAGKKVSVWLFQPDALTIRRVELDVKGEDVIVKGADSWETWRCEGPDGLVVNIDKDTHQVEKIVDPRSGLELDLESSKLKLK